MDTTIARRQRGFSVAEVLLALALITVTILALLGVSIYSLSADRKGRDLVAGQMVAEQALERIVYAAESNADAGLWYQNDAVATYASQVVTLTPTDYRVATYVTDLGGYPIGRRLKLVECLVTWEAAPQGKVRQGRLQVRGNRLLHE